MTRREGRKGEGGVMCGYRGEMARMRGKVRKRIKGEGECGGGNRY